MTEDELRREMVRAYNDHDPGNDDVTEDECMRAALAVARREVLREAGKRSVTMATNCPDCGTGQTFDVLQSADASEVEELRALVSVREQEIATLEAERDRLRTLKPRGRRAKHDELLLRLGELELCDACHAAVIGAINASAPSLALASQPSPAATGVPPTVRDKCSRVGGGVHIHPLGELCPHQASPAATETCWRCEGKGRVEHLGVNERCLDCDGTGKATP